jgi:putative nucleotidyltransferase with HDIG domain
MTLPAEASGHAPTAPREPRVVGSLDEAVQLFAALLLGTLRNALIYSPGHAHFLEVLGRAEQMAGVAFGFTPEIAFVCLERELFFAGKPMNRRGMQFQRLADFMTSLGIQRLQLRRGLAVAELKVFALNLIGLTDAGESTGQKRIVATPHIRVGRLKCPESEAEEMRSAIARGLLDSGCSEDRSPEAAPLSEAALREVLGEIAGCEAVVRLVASLARHAGYLAMLAALQRHHPPTYRHAINVALLAAAHAGVLGAAPEVVRLVALAGLFHDMGKVSVPAAILDAGGARSPDQERVYRQHCVAGAELLSRYAAIPPAAVVAALEHHLDARGGGGFPERPRAGAPHLISQIVGLADGYDHGRAAAGSGVRGLAAILDEMRSAPHRFRPDLLDSLVAALPAFEP